MQGVVVERKAALYYPCIQIQDVNWLKATLLCFPQVRRMAPNRFPVDDGPEIQPFTERRLGREPMLEIEELDTRSSLSVVRAAQDRLLDKLQEHAGYVRSRYTRRTLAASPRAGTARVHKGKGTYLLWEWLADNGLAWHVANGPGTWMEMHRTLAGAIMAVIAISIARSKGYDIVTDDPSVHHAVATQSEAEVFDSLLNLGEHPAALTPESDRAEELATVVMYTQFDVGRLDAEQIRELVREGKDLRRFKDALLRFVRRIPEVEDPEERRRWLEEKAEEVAEEWQRYRRGLPGFALSALYDAQQFALPGYATDLATGSSVEWKTLAGLGIALGLAVYKGRTTYKKSQEGTANPFAYLSRVDRAVRAGQALAVSLRASGPPPATGGS